MISPRCILQLAIFLGLVLLAVPALAASNPALDRLKFLITLQAQPDEEADNLENVKELVSGLDRLDYQDASGDNLFQIECKTWKKGTAARQQNPYLEILIPKTDFKSKNKKGETALHTLMSIGGPIGLKSPPTAVLKEMLSRGASWEAVDGNGNPPLFSLVLTESSFINPDDILVYLASGADARRTNFHGRNLLSLLVEGGRYIAASRLESVLAPISTGTRPARNTALLWASFKADLPVMQKMISLGAEVNAANARNREFPLYLASGTTVHEEVNWFSFSNFQRKTDGRAVKLLLSNNASVKQGDVYGVTALMRAASHSNAEVVELLIRAGSDLNAVAGFFLHESPLINAAANAQLKNVELLIQNGADVNVKAGGIKYAPATPLSAAVGTLNHAVVDTLLAAKATPNLWYGVKNGHLLNLVMMDGSPFLTLNLTGAGRSPIASNVILMDKLIRAGAGLQTSNSFSPLYVACYSGCTPYVRFLLEKGADVRVPEPNGESVIQAASMIGDVEMIRLLLTARAPVSQRAVVNAILRSHFEAAKLLVDAGPGLNQKSDQGTTPLHATVVSGNVPFCQWLLARGADASISNALGDTPSDLAFKSKKEPLIALFPEAARKVKNLARNHSSNKISLTIDERLALLRAAKAGDLEKARILVDRGANLNTAFGQPMEEFEAGLTPLMVAAKSGRAEIVRLLLDHGALLTANGSDKGATALTYAEAAKNNQIVKMLGDFQSATRRQNTKVVSFDSALTAASRGDLATVIEFVAGETLLVNMAFTETGMTLLMTAAQNGRAEVVKALLKHPFLQAGTINPRTGKTALNYAQEGGHLGVAELIKAKYRSVP